MSITVIKRNGSTENFEIDKIETHVLMSCEGLPNVSSGLLLAEVFRQCHNGMTTESIQNLIITTAAERISLEAPDWTYVAARATLQNIYKEVTGGSFRYPSMRSYLKKGIKEGVLVKSLLKKFDLKAIDEAIKPERDNLFKYLGILTVSDRYLVRDLEGKILELPQHFWMRVAMGLSLSEHESVRMQKCLEFYEVMSTMEYIPSTPTLFNSGTLHPQLSSCYLLSMGDDTQAINDTNGEASHDSKFAGGVAIDMSPVRCSGSYIRSTRGRSSGIVPYAHILNGVFNGFDQSGRRKGAGAIYLTDWHGDIEEFLNLVNPTGDFRRRAPDLFPAIWHTDLFMKRVEAKGNNWSLFSPNTNQDLLTLYGEEFEQAYLKAEESGQAVSVISADELWQKMIGKRFENGRYFACFKDTINKRRMQLDGVVRSSNLCTEVTLNTEPSGSDDVISAVCNLGSVNLSKVCPLDNPKRFEFVVKTGSRMLNNVVDDSFVPHANGRKFNVQDKAVGMGIMGYAEWLVAKGIDFESQEHLDLANDMMKYFAYYNIEASADLAQERGSYPGFENSRWARGELPKDTAWESAISLTSSGTAYNLPGMDEDALRIKVAAGMRNSHTMAIAPTATIANIVGTTECTQLPYELMYQKENLSGKFWVIAPTLLYPATRYQDARNVSQEWSIKAAAVRQIHLDQSQSTNLYLPTTRKVKGSEISSWYFLAWNYGVKTLYYLKGVSSKEVAQATTESAPLEEVAAPLEAEVKFCSIDNPECESCQ